MDSHELQHWGIKGMRWGVRRYQNKDGSLTPAGKKRYDADGDNSYDDDIEVKKDKILNSHSAKAIYANKDLFTDKEIQAAYQRLNTEKLIKDLIPKDPEEKSKVQKFIDSYTSKSKAIKSIVDASDDLYKSYEKAQKLLSKLNNPKTK